MTCGLTAVGEAGDMVLSSDTMESAAVARELDGEWLFKDSSRLANGSAVSSVPMTFYFCFSSSS